MPSFKLTEDYDGDILSWWVIRNKEQLCNEEPEILLSLFKEVWLDSETRFVHREDGPAIIANNGTENFMIMGRLHRLDGPAICNYESDEYFWYFHNKKLSEGKNDMLTRWWKSKCK
jgi:hypothetical protein